MADRVIRILLLPLMVYAVCGLVLSLTVHLFSLAGLQPPGGFPVFIGLHIGIFPLWLPVILIAANLSRGMRQTVGMRREYWNALLSGCPAWMKYMTYGFFVYAIVNFAIFMIFGPTGKHSGSDVPSSVWRGFSGHWMAFYSAGLAILTTAYRRGISNLQPKCPNGHDIGFGDKFCATCGVPIYEQQN